MAKEETRAGYWRRMVAEQEQSGQTVRAFCRQTGVGEHGFYVWRKRLRQEAAAEREPVRFALIEPRGETSASSAARIEVTLGTGDRIRISAGADAAMVGTVLAALRS